MSDDLRSRIKHRFLTMMWEYLWNKQRQRIKYTFNVADCVWPIWLSRSAFSMSHFLPYPRLCWPPLVLKSPLLCLSDHSVPAVGAHFKVLLALHVICVSWTCAGLDLCLTTFRTVCWLDWYWALTPACDWTCVQSHLSFWRSNELHHCKTYQHLMTWIDDGSNDQYAGSRSKWPCITYSVNKDQKQTPTFCMRLREHNLTLLFYGHVLEATFSFTKLPRWLF